MPSCSPRASALARSRSAGDALELRLALRRQSFAPFDCCSAELDGSELLLAHGDVAFVRAHRLLASGEIERQLRQRRVALVELGRSLAEHLLDGGPELPGAFLAPFEIADRRLELIGVLLDLAPLLLDPGLERVVSVGRGEQCPEPVADSVVT